MVMNTVTQVKQFLEDTKRYLVQMLRTINIKEEVVHVIQYIIQLCTY